MNLNKIIYFFTFTISFFLGTSYFSYLYADPIVARVALDSIQVIKPTEKGGDEIYFDVTQYSNQGQSNTIRLPEAPEYWLSNQLSQVKNITLWEGVVKDNEEVKVIFSVVEQDFPPWDVDELIGSALLVLNNINDTLQYHWEIPIFEEKVQQEMVNGNIFKPGQSLQYYVMNGDNSNYKVGLTVYSDKLTQINNQTSNIETNNIGINNKANNQSNNPPNNQQNNPLNNQPNNPSNNNTNNKTSKQPNIQPNNPVNHQ